MPSFPFSARPQAYLLFTEVQDFRNPKEDLALAERGRSLSSEPFQLYELLAAAYAENHGYREAADTKR
jgi:hypothetical protein